MGDDIKCHWHLCSGDAAQVTNKRGPALVSGLAPAAQAVKQSRTSRHEHVTQFHGSSAPHAPAPQAWQQLPLPATSGAMPVHGMYHASVRHPHLHQVDVRQIASGDTQSRSAHTGAPGTVDGMHRILHAAQVGVQPGVAVPGATGEVPVLAETPWWPATHPLQSTLPGNLHGLVNFMLDTQIAAHFQQHAAAVSACDPAGVCADATNVAGPSKNS